MVLCLLFHSLEDQVLTSPWLSCALSFSLHLPLARDQESYDLYDQESWDHHSRLQALAKFLQEKLIFCCTHLPQWFLLIIRVVVSLFSRSYLFSVLGNPQRFLSIESSPSTPFLKHLHTAEAASLPFPLLFASLFSSSSFFYFFLLYSSTFSFFLLFLLKYLSHDCYRFVVGGDEGSRDLVCHLKIQLYSRLC